MEAVLYETWRTRVGTPVVNASSAEGWREVVCGRTTVLGEVSIANERGGPVELQ